MSEWYERSFQEDYLRIYAHRDERKATQELEKLISFVPVSKGQKVLDLCCGQGRHSRWLASLGLQVVGVDLSAVLLAEAIKQSLNMNILYMRADVREVHFNEEMDHVVNLFTSFGYFSEDEENEKVFRNASRALKPGGYFVFDYLNPGYLRQHINPYSETEQGDLMIKQYRSINEQFVEKKIIIQEMGENSRQYEEKVKLYGIDQLKHMLQRNGLEIVQLFGDYDASNYQLEESPRIIYICRKAGN
ncbi:class I SAM-dependent methyltransferase [Ammoniphilus resinae]|uniref:SAM-dependent methyltransferase n=1 Tax=Ammoniphilus resinae TaxID=861532 RepID=A0ABS4GLN8_9BACL|nr:class I SAM-dependent methyltransferase [Ammoniphilus resinae]MBP1931159.1 SAM-dependent methyltransferase [Ammoniphilus resinae]